MNEISEIDGMPILEVTEASLIGTWCEYCPLSVGTLASEEFIFKADSTFRWRSLGLTDSNEILFPLTTGSWKLDEGLLKLNIEQREDPDQTPTQRVHFEIRMRENKGVPQLVMKSAIYDDEVFSDHHRLQTFPYKAQPGEADENHQAYSEKRKKKIVLDGPFKKLVSLLKKLVPAAVEELKLTEPLFCVRLYYHSTLAPAEDYRCWVRCLTVDGLSQTLATAEKQNIPDELWHPTAGIANGTPGQDAGLCQADLTNSAELSETYPEIYQLLTQDEEQGMEQLRAALRKVCLMLHMVKWPDSIPRSEDFIIFPADGSNHFGGEYEEDMLSSVPKQKLKILKEKGML